MHTCASRIHIFGHVSQSFFAKSCFAFDDDSHDDPHHQRLVACERRGRRNKGTENWVDSSEMKDDSANGESTAMMAKGAISHDNISDCQSPAAIAAALVTPTKKKHSSPPSSPPSAKVIHYTDARTKALGVKAELEELRRKQLAKNKRNEIGEEKWCATYKSLEESNRPHHSSSLQLTMDSRYHYLRPRLKTFFYAKLKWTRLGDISSENPLNICTRTRTLPWRMQESHLNLQ